MAWQLLLAIRWDVMTALGLTILCTMVPPELVGRANPLGLDGGRLS